VVLAQGRGVQGVQGRTDRCVLKQKRRDTIEKKSVENDLEKPTNLKHGPKNRGGPQKEEKKGL